MKQLSPQGRVGLLDEIRGLCILGVILSHGLYDLVYMFDMSIPFYHTKFVQIYVQTIGSGAFILISGIVSRYSRNNLKRGLQSLGIGTALTVVLGIFMPSAIVRFGVLSLLGVGMLLYALVEAKIPKLLEVPASSKGPFLIFVLSLLMFGVTFLTSKGYWGMLNYPLIKLPNKLYEVGFLYPMGFPDALFYSTDYFPILPWIFLFIGGGAIGVYFKEGKMPSFFYRNYIPFLAYAGKNSLVIYLVHQPILYGLFMLFL